MNLFKSFYDSPIGMAEVTADEKGISSIQFTETENLSWPSNDITRKAVLQLEEYFKGRRKDFSLELNSSGTGFQQKIWSELKKIPFGETVSYLDIAHRLNAPTASRAVGNANSKNNVLIVLPCHRVIGQSGSLVGYAGELWRKKWLLEHELKFSSGNYQMRLDI